MIPQLESGSLGGNGRAGLSEIGMNDGGSGQLQTLGKGKEEHKVLGEKGLGV
jgi:hypothetical protein